MYTIQSNKSNRVLEVSTGPGRMRAGPGPGRFYFEPGRAGRAGPNNFNSLAIRAESSRIFKNPGRIQLKDKLKNSKFSLLLKISYLIINKSYIFNNVHNLSLICFVKVEKLFEKYDFVSISKIFNKISLIILIIIFFFAKFVKFFLQLFKKLFKNALKFVNFFINYYDFC